MGRSLYLLALLGACSYSAPPSPAAGEDATVRPDSEVVPDVPVDAEVQPPDTMPPDGPATPQTTDHVASQDTWIDSAFLNEDDNHGGTTTLLIDGSPAATGLMRFDLSGLATTTTVMAVELHVFTTSDTGDTVTVFPMLESWFESSATWNRRGANMAWATTGARPPSRGTTAIATFTPNTANTEITTELDVATVQGWITDPAKNLGIALTVGGFNEPILRSRQAMTGKPFLRITHTP
jgi:hypothetical protein